MHMKATKHSKGKQMTEYLKSFDCLRLLLLVIVPPMYFPCDLTITCYVTLNECHWNECILWTKQNPKCFAYKDNNQYLWFFVYVYKKTPPMHFSCCSTHERQRERESRQSWNGERKRLNPKRAEESTQKGERERERERKEERYINVF